MADEFTLREMQQSDSPAIRQLITEVALGDMTTYFDIDPYVALTASDTKRTYGVVVEKADEGRVVGLATVTFGDVQIEGDVLPFGYLANLKVHSDFRNRGLGTRLAQWRVQRAEAEFGQQGVIATGMEISNHASRATARKWCREFIEPVKLAIVPVKSRPPTELKGVTVREAQPSDVEEIAAKQNAFYRDYNLYEPVTPDSLQAELGFMAAGHRLHRYFVAVNSAGGIVAGLQVRRRGVLMYDQINNLPAPLRLLNRVAHIVPSDLKIREVGVKNIWFLPDHLSSARYLWHTSRWLGRTDGSNLSASFDARSPLADVFALKPWHQPKVELAFAIRAPKSLRPDRLFASSRVR